MNEKDLDDFVEKMSQPGRHEKAFFERRRALGLGVGLDENGEIVRENGPVFIDFKVSSLTPNGLTIAVGVAWVDNGQVASEAKLIEPDRSWSINDWDDESGVHDIPRKALNAAEPTDNVAKWLQDKLVGKLVVSDGPEFDQRRLDQLMKTAGEQHEIRIDDFGQLVWLVFSEMDGQIGSGRPHEVYSVLANEKAKYRADDDAAKLARAWLSGINQKIGN